jgi:hypothetical protein
VPLRAHGSVRIGRRSHHCDVVLLEPVDQVGGVLGSCHRQPQRRFELGRLLASAERGGPGQDQRHGERHDQERDGDHATVAEGVEQLLAQHDPERPHA